MTKRLRKLSLLFLQKSLATFGLRNVSTGHFYLAICKNCGQNCWFVARKCGQLATFENKCGHENDQKIVKKGLKMAKKGLFWAIFGQKSLIFIFCGHLATFFLN